MSRILIVEDEPSLAMLLAEYLGAAGYETETSLEGSGVVDKVKQDPPDLILLDLMLPGVDGMDICRGVRQFSELPIIMVTARAEEIDRLLGLELGADDYICKPYSPREVVARVKAVLRRLGAVAASPNNEPAGSVIGINGLIINDDSFSATLHNTLLDLTRSEFRLLKILSTQPGRVYSRGQLQDQLYDDHRIVSDRTIDTHVKNLRRKLSVANQGQGLIQSVYGVGYKLEPEG